MVIPTLLAVLVPLLFLYLIASIDLRARKRRNLLIITFFWGIAVFFMAYLLFTFLVNNHVFTLKQIVTFIAPVIEELLKAACLIVLARGLYIRSAVDGAAYGFAIGIGFSIAENLIYITTASPGTALETALARVLSTNLMHGFTTGLVGATLGSNYYRSRHIVQMRTTLALVVAFAIHGLYNQIVSHVEGIPMVALAIVFGLSAFAILLFVVTLAMNAERDWIEAQMQREGAPAGERMAEANPRLFAELLAKQKIGLDEHQRQLLNEYVRLRGEKAVLTRKIALQAKGEFYKNIHDRDVEITHKLAALNREMGIYLRMIVRLILPSSEDTSWIALSKELGMTSEPFMRALVNMGERQHALTNEELLKRRQVLKKTLLFNSLVPAELDDLSLLLDQVAVPKGQNIEIQGQYDGHLFIVVNGSFSARVTDIHGHEIIVALYATGSTFGELSLIDLKPHPVTISALEDSLLYALSRDQFIILIAARPDVNFRLLKELTGCIRDQTELITLVRYIGIHNLPPEAGEVKAKLPQETLPSPSRMGI
ncbi:MAG: PrsW family intramembrane metalloprotease [Anaerolineae bacterium]|nr:PrsW family intramembrane metalloprotease [Anaerolineae bacterium]